MVLFPNGGRWMPDPAGGAAGSDGSRRGCRAAARRRTDAGGAHSPERGWRRRVMPGAGRVLSCGGQLAVCVGPFWMAPKEQVPRANARNAPPSGVVIRDLVHVHHRGPPFSTSDAVSETSAILRRASSVLADSADDGRVAASARVGPPARKVGSTRVAYGGSRPGPEGRFHAPEERDAQRVQVVRAADHLRVRDRRDVHRRPQRIRQVERRRRPRLGDGGAGGEDPPRRQDGGRHLRRHRDARPARSRRGAAHDRQQRRRAADRVLRGEHQSHALPQRRERVRHQRRCLPPAGRAGAAQRLRPRPRDARDRRPGPPRQRAPGVARGATGLHRGGRRDPQAPPAQGEDPPQARRDGGEPHPAERSRRRAAPSAEAARTPGGDRARSGDDRSGGPRCQSQTARRRARGPAHGTRGPRAQRAGAPLRATGPAGSAREHPRASRAARGPAAFRGGRRGAARRVRPRARAGAAARPVHARRAAPGAAGRDPGRRPHPGHVDLAGDDRRGARRDRRDRRGPRECAGCRDRGDRAMSARARAELDALDTDIAAQSALVSKHDMRITALRGSAEAAASALAAVQAAVERQQRALDAALARRAEAEESARRGRSGPRAGGVRRGVRVRVREGPARCDRGGDQGRRDCASDSTPRSARSRRSTAQTAALGRALDVKNAAAELVARGGPASGDSSATRSRSRRATRRRSPRPSVRSRKGCWSTPATDAFATARVARDGDLGVVDIAIADAADRPAELARRSTASCRRAMSCRRRKACSASCPTSWSPTTSTPLSPPARGSRPRRWRPRHDRDPLRRSRHRVHRARRFGAGSIAPRTRGGAGCRG